MLEYFNKFINTLYVPEPLQRSTTKWNTTSNDFFGYCRTLHKRVLSLKSLK